MARRLVETPIEVPENFPEYGELEGKRIRLRDAAKTLSRIDMAGVLVDVPGVGKRYPWRGQDLELP
jgi:hypothetical protein